MKKIFRLAPFLSILWAYLHIAFFVFLELIDNTFIIFILLIIGNIVLCLLNILNAITLDYSELGCSQRLRTGCILKIVNTPYFIFMFMMSSLAIALILFPGGILIAPIIIAIILLMTLPFFISSSAYGIVSTIYMFKMKYIKIKTMIICIIMQCILFLDIIAMIYLYVKWHRVVKNSIKG
jgi:membrane protein